jgi:acyl carrier protein
MSSPDRCRPVRGSGKRTIGLLFVNMPSNQLTKQPCRETASDLGLSPRERLHGLVVGIVAPKSPNRSFSDDETLTEIGVTSVDMVTLLLSVESEFGVEVPQHEITADVFRSISTIDNLIRRLLPDAPGRDAAPVARL